MNYRAQGYFWVRATFVFYYTSIFKVYETGG